jgi:signal transduction histidine kinase
MESTSEIKTIFWIGSAIIIMIIMGFLFMATYYQRSVAKMKRKEAETLLKTALESEKNERARISKDLHDSVQGDLSAIRNFLAMYIKSKTDKTNIELLQHINDAVIQTIENTRMISHKLMPPMIESDGFVAAMTLYLQNLEKANHVQFNIKDVSQECKIDKSIAYELFRVVQEFTNNMLKYGSIQECNLIIYEIQGRMAIEIIDDGIPFDFKKEYLSSKGAGLQNIQSRLNSIGAQLEQRSVFKGNHFVIHLK